MMIFFYVFKNIITNKDNIFFKLFYALLSPYNKNVKISKYVSEVYIYHLRRYMINLRFIFYELLRA
jgi:hypothetical protein